VRIRFSRQHGKGFSDLVRSSCSRPDAEAAAGQLRIKLSDYEAVASYFDGQNAGVDPIGIYGELVIRDNLPEKSGGLKFYMFFALMFAILLALLGVGGLLASSSFNLARKTSTLFRNSCAELVSVKIIASE